MQKASRGDLESALQLAQTAKSALPDDPMVGDTLGWIYYKKGLTALAVSTLQQSAGASPSSATIQYHLGLAHLKTGNRKEARRALEQALKLKLGASDADDAKRVLASIQG
jgi:Flp pilus assembly protein TadD